MKTKEKTRHQTHETELQRIARGLEVYLGWLDDVIASRMKSYFEENPFSTYLLHHLEMPHPRLGSPLEKTIADMKLEPAEVLLLLLAMAPQLRPQMLDIFFTKNTLFDRGFSEFGGIKGEVHGGFIPTAETAMFLLAGKDLDARIHYRGLFQPDHRLYRLQLLQSPVRTAKDTDYGFALLLSEEFKGYFFSGAIPRPEFGPNFPARIIETNLAWEDLVLDRQTVDDLLEVKAWLRHGPTLMHQWGMQKIIKPGFRSLFYGPPGTGKSLAATLLGKLTGRDVYRIDLSMVVSKYIGETEKNLASIFDQAQEKEWILFFDEADALFGKRTTTSSSHDRYANQEVSFLLQRVEDFPGTVILATNFKQNMDRAFLRRFQSVVQFLKPDKSQRLRLWRQAFSGKIPPIMS
jgi:hypothetical protein